MNIFYNGYAYVCQGCGTVYKQFGMDLLMSRSSGYGGYVPAPNYSSSDFEIVAAKLVKYKGQSANVVIPDNVTVIGGNSFSHCTGLTGVTIPNSVNVIEAGAFSGCTGLTSINIPNSIKEICPYAFEECTSLTSIEIPNGVEKIDEWAFCRCTGLISIFIPNSVTYIAPTAFDGCTNLENIYGNTPPFMDSFRRTPFFARSENWVHNNRCRYCGNKFKGSRNPKCSSCGHYKDY